MGEIAKAAYIYTQGLRQVQAVANLGDAAASHHRHAADRRSERSDAMFFPGSRYASMTHLQVDAAGRHGRAR